MTRNKRTRAHPLAWLPQRSSKIKNSPGSNQNEARHFTVVNDVMKHELRNLPHKTAFTNMTRNFLKLSTGKREFARTPQWQLNRASKRGNSMSAVSTITNAIEALPRARLNSPHRNAQCGRWSRSSSTSASFTARPRRCESSAAAQRRSVRMCRRTSFSGSQRPSRRRPTKPSICFM